MQEDQVIVEPLNKWKTLRMRLAIVLAGIGIFSLGVFTGQGNITFNSRHIPVSTNLPASLDFSTVNDVYQLLKQNYDGTLTTAQLENGLKKGLANATNDPYTEYFSAKEAQQFSDQLNNTFSGIGAELGKDANSNLVVVSPIKDKPAAKAGIKAKDIIVTIDGKSTQGYSVDQAVSLIRGKKGTTVKLQIVRAGKQLDFAIVRQDIKLPSVTSKITDDNIGYIQISTFGEDTAVLVDKAAASFQQKHVKGVILDLRGNPGGLVTAAKSVASQWLPEDTLILQQKHGGTVIEEDRSEGEHRLLGMPTVVLVNGGSASASEITTGALRDNNAAYIIGEKSFGKGVVQQVFCVTGNQRSDGSCPSDELKVTIASWYRPNGQNINHKGITPDRTIKLTDADVAKGNDTQKNAALQYLLKK